MYFPANINTTLMKRFISNKFVYIRENRQFKLKIKNVSIACYDLQTVYFKKYYTKFDFKNLFSLKEGHFAVKIRHLTPR